MTTVGYGVTNYLWPEEGKFSDEVNSFYKTWAGCYPCDILFPLSLQNVWGQCSILPHHCHRLYSLYVSNEPNLSALFTWRGGQTVSNWCCHSRKEYMGTTETATETDNSPGDQQPHIQAIYKLLNFVGEGMEGMQGEILSLMLSMFSFLTDQILLPSPVPVTQWVLTIYRYYSKQYLDATHFRPLQTLIIMDFQCIHITVPSEVAVKTVFHQSSIQEPARWVQLKTTDHAMTLYVSQMKNMNRSWYHVHSHKNYWFRQEKKYSINVRSQTLSL